MKTKEQILDGYNLWNPDCAISEAGSLSDALAVGDLDRSEKLLKRIQKRVRSMKEYQKAVEEKD